MTFIVACVGIAIVVILARWLISLTGLVIPQPLLIVLGLLLFLVVIYWLFGASIGLPALRPLR